MIISGAPFKLKIKNDITLKVKSELISFTKSIVSSIKRVRNASTPEEGVRYVIFVLV